MSSKLINIRKDVITALDQIKKEEGNISYSEVIERLIVNEPERSKVKAFVIAKLEEYF